MGDVKNVLSFYLNITGSKRKRRAFIVVVGYLMLGIFYAHFMKSTTLEYLNNLDSSLDSLIGYLIYDILWVLCWLIILIDFYINKHTEIFNSLPIKRFSILITNFLIIISFSATIVIQIISIYRVNISMGRNYYVTSFIGFAIALFCICFILVSFSMGFLRFKLTKGKLRRYLFIAFTFSFQIFDYFIERMNINFGSSSYMGETTVAGKILTDIIEAHSVLGGLWGFVTIALSVLLGYFICVTWPLKLSMKEG